jgi:hypothetical protein
MAILDTDLKLRLSGGASNTSAAASLGGAKSTVAGGIITTNVLNNLWDDTSGDESEAGDVEYRCVYISNEHGSLTWTNPKVWIESQTPSTDTSVSIALGTSAVNGTEQTIGDEDTEPAGVSWSEPSNKAAGLSLGNLPFGEHKAIWIRKTVTLGAGAYDDDAYTIKYSGETSA